MAATREVVVVGAGLAGLAAAHALKGRDVVVYEADERAGGRVFSQKRQPYWMSVGAHILGGPGTPMGRLATEFGLTLAPIPGDLFAMWTNGKLVRGGKPELAPFRLPLPFMARVSLVQAGLRLRRAALRAATAAPDVIHGDRQFDGDYPTAQGDAGLDALSFAEIVGRAHPDVAALMRTAANRLSAEPDELSALFGANAIGSLWVTKRRHVMTVLGGLGEIARGLEERVRDRLVMGARVVRVVPGGETAEVHVRRAGVVEVVRARFVVFAATGIAARETVAPLPPEKAQALSLVRYGPYLAMAAATREAGPAPHDDIYAVALGGRTLAMIFNTVSPLRTPGAARAPGGALMMYAGADRAAALLDAPEDDIRRLFLDDVYAVFPHLRGQIEETWIRRIRHGYPFWAPGRLAAQDAIARPVGNVYFAGDWTEYPSTDAAVRTGQLAARAILKRLA